MKWQISHYRLTYRTLFTNFLIVLLSTFIVSSLMFGIETSHANEDSEHYSVLVLAGQSNAQGDTSFTSSLNPPLGSHPADSATKIMWSMGDEQLSATWHHSPSNELKSLTDRQFKGYFGPEIGIARTLWDQGRRNMVFLKVTYGLQRLAQTPSSQMGGITDWNVHSENESYDMLVQRKNQLANIIRDNGDTYSVDAFYWMQGESDAIKAESVENYENNLTELLESVRVDLQMHPDAVNVIGKISGQQCLSNVYNIIMNPNGCAVSICILSFHPCSTYEKVAEGNENVRQAIQNVADNNPRTFAVETQDLLRGADYVHLTAASQLTLGTRMANPQYVLPFRLEGSNDYDGDGILNVHEDSNGDGNLGNDDDDGDGIPNYLDSIDGPGGGRNNSVIASKRVTDSEGNPLSQATPGSVLNWKISLTNQTTSTSNLELIETISDRQQFVSDSLDVPPNYLTEYSSDWGSNFTSSQDNVNALRVTKTNVPESAKGATNQVTKNAESFASSGSGHHGYLPILVGDRVFTLFANTFGGQGPTNHRYDIGCISKITGNNCPGYPKDFHDGNGNFDFLSPNAPGHYLDDEGRIFSSTQRSAGFGIVCFDTTINDMCEGNEYTALSETGGPLNGTRKTRIQQLNKIGDCLFTYDYTLKVYSYDPATGSTPCNGKTMKNLVSAYGGVVTAYNLTDHSGVSHTGPVTQSQVLDNKMYIYMNYAYEANLDIFGCNVAVDICRGTRVICFDATTSDGRCSNGQGGYFSSPRPQCYNDRFCKMTQPFINKVDNTICAFAYRYPSFVYSGIFCQDPMTGSQVTISPELQTISTKGRETIDSVSFLPTYEEAELVLPNGDEITIFAWEKAFLIDTPRSGKAVCYNWTKNELCQGFGVNGTGATRWDQWSHNGITSLEVGVVGDTFDFGYAPDDNGCVWGKGKSGDTWSFDAINGSVPCRRAAQEVTVAPSQFYCEAITSKFTSWKEAKIDMPIGTSIEDLSELKITITDSNSNPIDGFENIDLLTESDLVTSIGVLDISSISKDQHSELKAEFEITAKNSNPWAGSSSPLVVLTFEGDDPEICYQTVVENACNIITPLTNNGYVKSSGGTETRQVDLSATLMVEYDFGESCIPDIRVTTNIYESKVFPGQELTYNILVENVANSNPESTANNIELASFFPDNTEFVSSSSGVVHQDHVQWPAFNLEGASSKEFTLTIRVLKESLGSVLLVTNALLDGDPTPYNNIFTSYNEIGALSIIKAKAWLDANEDGIADEDETALEDVEVRLYRDDELIETETTNEDGEIEFDAVTPGIGYQVHFIKPLGYETSPQRLDVEENPASVVDEINQMTDVFVLSEGEIRSGIFAGFYPVEISNIPTQDLRENEQPVINEEQISEPTDDEDSNDDKAARAAQVPPAEEIVPEVPSEDKLDTKKINTMLIYSSLVALNLVGVWFLIREIRKNKRISKLKQA